MSREQALAIIRADEQAVLKHLPPPNEHESTAYTAIPVTRALYALIERPPTRHKTFVIRTYWRLGTEPICHGVFVSSRGKVRQVMPDQAGLFGAS